MHAVSAFFTAYSARREGAPVEAVALVVSEGASRRHRAEVVRPVGTDAPRLGRGAEEELERETRFELATFSLEG